MSVSTIKSPMVKIIPSSELMDFIHTNFCEEDIPEPIKSYNHNKNEGGHSGVENVKSQEEDIFLSLHDFYRLKKTMDQLRLSKKINAYAYEFLQNCTIVLPENEIIPRDADLEARCEKLRAAQANTAYMNITKNVDTSIKQRHDDSFAYQLKEVNRQIIAVVQFICSVVAGFVFGFLGVELIVGNLDFGFRLLLGIMCALVIALAEIYFLAKKLNECEDMLSSKLKKE